MYCIEVTVPKGWFLRPITSRADSVFGSDNVKDVHCTEMMQYDKSSGDPWGSLWKVSFVVEGFTEENLHDYALQMKDLGVWDCRAYKLLDCMRLIEP